MYQESGCIGTMAPQSLRPQLNTSGHSVTTRDDLITSLIEQIREQESQFARKTGEIERLPADNANKQLMINQQEATMATRDDEIASLQADLGIDYVSRSTRKWSNTGFMGNTIASSSPGPSRRGSAQLLGHTLFIHK
jgi:hypothetical protein